MEGTRLLVVQHEDPCPPAMLGGWLEEAGCALDVRRPYAGDPLPEVLRPGPGGHDAVLVLGGAMNAEQDHLFDWLGPTKGLLRAAVERDVPVLGVCLGHQLLAVALGGRVERNPQGRQEGLVPVGWEPSAAQDPLLGPLAVGGSARRAVHWNDDVVVGLPPGAVRLATAPGGEVQAVRYAPRAWGVQWHPEADAGVLAGWPGTAAAVPAVRAAHEELVAAWRPLAASLAALAAGTAPSGRVRA